MITFRPGLSHKSIENAEFCIACTDGGCHQGDTECCASTGYFTDVDLSSFIRTRGARLF